MISLNNTSTRFGIVAIFFHWVMALLIVGLLILGLYMTRIPISLEKLKLFGWHKEWGMLALFLVVLRLLWRFGNVVPSLDSLTPLERIAARSVHFLFYFLLLAIPLSGWLITSAADLPVSFFGWIIMPNLISPDEERRLLFTEIHRWLSYFLIAILGMHIGAALKHHFINKDDIMKRMLRP